MSTPHKRPVCGGRGKMHESFYAAPILPGVSIPSVSATPPEVTCRSCHGAGILWVFGTTPNPAPKAPEPFSTWPPDSAYVGNDISPERFTT